MSKVLELEKEMLEKLEDNLNTAKGGNNYLEGIAKMDVSILFKYSARNVMLIFSQYKQAQRLRTFKGWAQEKKNIVKGSKAINILQPVPFCETHRNTNDCPSDCADKKMFFKGLPLFDIKQTDAPLEEVFFKAKGGETNEELVALLKKGIGIDFEITDNYANEDESGFTIGEQINISKNLSQKAYALTLLHEGAHMYYKVKLNDKDHSKYSKSKEFKAKSEIKTEALAIMLANHLQIELEDDIIPEAYGYIKKGSTELKGTKISELVKEAVNAYKKIITENEGDE